MTTEEARKKYGKVDPDQKNVFINWDAIDSLPEQYEVVISELIFDPKKLDDFFTNIAKKTADPVWYPGTDMSYKIAAMTNISGCKDKLVESIFEEVEEDMLEPNTKLKKGEWKKRKVAMRVTKTSMIFCEDGTWRPSSPCSNTFNFWNRACLEFLTEEEYTESYTHLDKFKNPFKYDTKIKRLKRLYELEKFAAENAETKSFCKTVRELAGLQTGFSTKDLQSGKFVFQKYVKSKASLKLELAARVSAISQGKTEEIQQLGADIFEGTKQITEPEPENITPQETESDFTEPDKTEGEQIKEIKNKLEWYIDINGENRKVIEKRTDVLEYIQNSIRTETNLNKLKLTLKRVEDLKGITKIVIEKKEFDPFQPKEEPWWKE